MLANRYVKSPRPDFAEAATWYRRAAEAGHQAAARALASLYLAGNGVAKDAEKERAGCALPQVAAIAKPRSTSPILSWKAPATPDEARWRTGSVGCVIGRPLRRSISGCASPNGIGVRKDEEQAAKWLRHAAEGWLEAQYMYARMLQDGRGVAADQKQARVWFERAAKAGMVDAQVALAEMLLQRARRRTFAHAAARLFKQAAATGHTGAMYALGALYESGQGLQLDRKAAQKWFAAAAERGHGQAQLMLGRYLSKGIAGEHDPVAGRMWLERAAAQGVD